jgi:phospholipase C
MTTGPADRDAHAVPRRMTALLVLLAGFLVLTGRGAGRPDAVFARATAQPAGIERIQHIIVVYQENWSFDSLYGRFPGANGIANAGDTARQVDKSGRSYPVLPQPLNGGRPDTRFPADLPNGPFDASRYVKPDERTGDMIHRFYQQQLQINGGAMDKFVAWTDAGGLVMSYYDATDMPEGRLAQQYTIADNFFHAAYGGSYLNHFWLICGCMPVWPDAPADLVSEEDANRMMVRDGAVTPDGFSINTTQPRNPPFAGSNDPARRLPPQTMPTIGDRLREAGISWAWYAGGWNDAVAGRPNGLFQFHHQPFNYFANYADGRPTRAEHLKDTDDLFAALRDGTLPAVSFVKPLGEDNEHPGYATLSRGQEYVGDLVAAVKASRHWQDTVIIIAYDENGGRWDHVAPPKIDRWGPGTRVPAIIISPFARRGFVDHTVYDTTSILALIETRWGLAPLGPRDAAANNMLAAFDFDQGPPDPGNTVTTEDLNGVSCISTTYCKAAGQNGTIISFNGATWSADTSTTSQHLLGVSCVSQAFCKAVGRLGRIRSWDGNSWSGDTSPTMEDLNGVSCTSATLCKAVGQSGTLLTWNGSSWRAETSTTSQDLIGVSCFSANVCKAVGALGRIRSWDGNAWSGDTSPTTENLRGVFCGSPAFCKAVGEGGTIVSWNGSDWTGQESTTSQTLLGVHCESTSMCKAVGRLGRVRFWDGSRWGADASPTSLTLYGVACPSPFICVVVGSGGTTWVVTL